GIDTPRGTDVLDSAEAACAFMRDVGGPILRKAVAGGGGRGIRIVRHAQDLAEAFERCRSEARASFGDERVYAEELIVGARHVEVQLVGDGASFLALGERECSLQRRPPTPGDVALAPGCDT